MFIDSKEPGKFRVILFILIAGFAVLLVRLWQLQILKGSEYRTISGKNTLRIIGIPAPRGIIYDRNGIPLVKNTPYFSASIIREEFDIQKLPALSILIDVPLKELSAQIGRKSISSFKPVRIKERLSFREVSYIEARRSEFPGLIIEIDVSREYIFQKAGAHVIGYLGKLSPEQSKDSEFRDVPPEAFIGQRGVEKLYDQSLRGIAGQRVIEIDALGREMKLLSEIPPVKGDDIHLGLDINVQTEAEQAFEGKRGAFVAVKPFTGEILALVSSPSYDPNKFAAGISSEEWSSITSDPAFPMLNRAIQSQYPPGSVFKIITAIAGLEKGAVDSSTSFLCTGSLSYGGSNFGCWQKKGHGTVSLHRALVESCDVYFYETGKRLGIDAIYEYATRFGLGKETRFPFPGEKNGLIPNTEWKLNTKKSKWFLGETFINAIGQGYVSVTPMQMALMISTVANNGKVLQPSILMDPVPAQIEAANIGRNSLELVKDSLRGVVEEPRGTGKAAKSQIVSIAGKTGTAQVVGKKKDSSELSEKERDHAWFVAYAPIDQPQIAVATFVENGGHGGSVAAPIAKKAIEAFFKPKTSVKDIINVQD